MEAPAFRRRKGGRKGGFTLLELLIVIAIIAVVSAILLPRFASSERRADINACKRLKAHINALVEMWYFNHGQWPDPSLSDIGSDPNYFPKGIPRCPFDGTAYELDPNTHRVKGHDHSRRARRVIGPRS